MSLFTDQQYRPYVWISLFLHILIFTLLVTNISFDQTEKTKTLASKDESINKDVIKASVVPPQQVQQEIARLEKIEKDKKLQEQLKERKLQEEIAKMRKQKELEAQKIADEKRKAKELKHQQEELAKKAQELKAEKLKMEQKAKNDLKKQQQELVTKLKKEQEQKLLESLQEEDLLLAETGKRQALVEKEIDRYIALQQAKVSRNWISRDSFLGQSLMTKLEIRLAEDGRVISVTIVKASGNQALDISAKNAILKASPLPLPSDESLRSNFRVYRFTFRPDELTS